MVDNLTFDDGEPITNTKLQSLYTAIKKLEGDVAKNTLENKTTNTKFIPTIYSGKSPDITLTNSMKGYDVTFDGFSFSSSNLFITLTPGNVSGSVKVGSIDYHVGTITSSGFRIYVSSVANNGKSMYFYYTAVEMKQSV